MEAFNISRLPCSPFLPKLRHPGFGRAVWVRAGRLPNLQFRLGHSQMTDREGEVSNEAHPAAPSREAAMAQRPAAACALARSRIWARGGGPAGPTTRLCFSFACRCGRKGGKDQSSGLGWCWAGRERSPAGEGGSPEGGRAVPGGCSLPSLCSEGLTGSHPLPALRAWWSRSPNPVPSFGNRAETGCCCSTEHPTTPLRHRLGVKLFQHRNPARWKG